MKDSSLKKCLWILTLIVLILPQVLGIIGFNLADFHVISRYDYINQAIPLYICIPFFIIIYLYQIIVKKRKLDIFDYLFYVIVIGGIITTIFSIDIYTSIFGKSLRHEGFLSILSYYLLFINWKNIGSYEDIKKGLKLIIIIAIINSLYSILQIYFDIDIIHKFSINSASGLSIHPNFFGSLMVTILSIITCKFLYDKKFNIRDYIILILLYVSLINCQSSGPFSTYIVVILFLIVFLIIKKTFSIKKLIVLIITTISLFYIITFVNNKVIEQPRCEICNFKENNIDTGGNGRFNIWDETLKIVKDNWLIGIGYDNLYLAYPNPKVEESIGFSITGEGVKRTTPTSITVVDAAHNIYLHTLATSGIIGLIPYLIICLLTFIRGLKSKNKLIFMLLAGFVAYSIQGFANISIIQVAPIYYFIIGLMLIKYDGRHLVICQDKSYGSF